MDQLSDKELLLRKALSWVSRFHLYLWRLGLGQWLNAWPKVLGRYLVITHTGRKSGLKRYTSANYAEVDGEIYCVSGFGAISDWYRNLRVNPRVEIWLPDGWWACEAEEIIGGEKRLPLIHAIMVGSGFAAYAAGINPNKISQDELAAVTAPYKLIHFHRTNALTGSGGPGDLAWVWPAATFFLLYLLSKRRRR
jgi:deazaflavin-dependent oxidoreductase (nitroreductase family)